MKKIIFSLVFLCFFIIGFTQLKGEEIIDCNTCNNPIPAETDEESFEMDNHSCNVSYSFKSCVINGINMHFLTIYTLCFPSTVYPIPDVNSWITEAIKILLYKSSIKFNILNPYSEYDVIIRVPSCMTYVEQPPNESCIYQCYEDNPDCCVKKYTIKLLSYWELKIVNIVSLHGAQNICNNALPVGQGLPCVTISCSGAEPIPPETILNFSNSNCNEECYWTIWGNLTTNSDNFLGTIDNDPLIIKTNSKARIAILPNGKIDIFAFDDPQDPNRGLKIPPLSHDNYLLGIDGKIVVRELIVKIADWRPYPDFVFNKNYKLTPLNEVEDFILSKGHLQGIPKASEIQENGVNVGDFQAKLLQKIEELTLYIIQTNKKVEKLEKENKILKSKLLKKK